MGDDPVKDSATSENESQDPNPHFGGGKSDFALQVKWDEKTRGKDEAADKDDKPS
jgi:hypothetical protein